MDRPCASVTPKATAAGEAVRQAANDVLARKGRDNRVELIPLIDQSESQPAKRMGAGGDALLGISNPMQSRMSVD